MNKKQELNSFKQKFNDLLLNIKNLKKVDKDIIDQMNQNVSQLGCAINNFILKDEDSGDCKDLIAEVIQLYEKTTQNLDNLIYKHKNIHEHLLSGYKIQNQKPIDETASGIVEPQQEISEFSYFQHLEKLNVLEDNNIEFKNYTIDSFNQRTARITFKKTIVSFLNRNGGCIYIGIRDDTTVVGMKLNHQEMDVLKRRIITIKSGISPSMNEKVKVDFIPVKQGLKWYKGHWIVRVRIQQGDLNTLYYFENQQDPYYLESYFREDGAVIRYKINDFIEEKIAISQNRNPKSRITVKKEYCQPDIEGFQACMVWMDNQQGNNNTMKRNDNNQQFQYKNPYYLGQFQAGQEKYANKDQFENINEIKYEDSLQRNNNYNNNLKGYQKKPLQMKTKIDYDPFQKISIQENELEDFDNLNQGNINRYQDQVQKNVQFKEDNRPNQFSSPILIDYNQQTPYTSKQQEEQKQQNQQQIQQFQSHNNTQTEQQIYSSPITIKNNNLESNSHQFSNDNSIRQNSRVKSNQKMNVISSNRQELQPQQANIINYANNMPQQQAQMVINQQQNYQTVPFNNQSYQQTQHKQETNTQNISQQNHQPEKTIQQKPNRQKRFGALFYESLYNQQQN